MPVGKRQRKQVTLTYSSGNRVAQQLNRGMQFRAVELRLTCAPTLTNANNTAAKTLRGDEWAVVKKIEIMANGTDVVKTISGPELRWLNAIYNGVMPNVTSTLADGATANPSCDSTLIIPFMMPRSIRPIDTLMDSSVMSNLEIAVTWGTYTDINASATGWTTQPTLEVNSKESFGQEGSKFSNWRLFSITKDISATNSQFQIDLPVNAMYRGFSMIFTDANVESAAILNNFRWKSGTNVFADVSGPILNAEWTANIGLDRNRAASTFKSTSSVLGGVYHYDHVDDGYLSEAIDTLGYSEHHLELDVTVGGGATQVIVIPWQIIPVRSQK